MAKNVAIGIQQFNEIREKITIILIKHHLLKNGGRVEIV